MDVSKLLSEPEPESGIKAPVGLTPPASESLDSAGQNTPWKLPSIANLLSLQSPDPVPQPPKVVSFPLILDKSHGSEARLPLRVNVTADNTVDSIISTVKNFYGLYGEQGVSFGGKNGIAMIPQYENLSTNSTVYVYLVPGSSSPQSQNGYLNHTSTPASAFYNGTNLYNDPLLYPHAEMELYKTRTYSPSHPHEGRSRGLYIDTEGAKNYNEEDDGTSVSVTSSKKGKGELVSAEISLTNIVEGNRRNGVKFESANLPMYRPPHIIQPISMSSESPVKNNTNATMASIANNNMVIGAHNALPSPQSFGRSASYSAVRGSSTQTPGYTQRLRAPRTSSASGHAQVPLTPEMTAFSTVSDEEAAWQLMRLGDPSQGHVRGAASTVDETLSGKVEISSTNGSSDEDHTAEGPSGCASNHGHAAGPPKKKLKAMTGTNASPLSNSFPASRKNSTGTGQSLPELGTDEEDLSAKPRCQRCRKSKKGCDRQRPCQRCKDAGIGIDGCVSEDEGNGRKGRFGRVIGVAIKKESLGSAGSEGSPSASGFTNMPPPPPRSLNDSVLDKSKKRKR